MRVVRDALAVIGAAVAIAGTQTLLLVGYVHSTRVPSDHVDRGFGGPPYLTHEIAWVAALLLSSFVLVAVVLSRWQVRAFAAVTIAVLGVELAVGASLAKLVHSPSAWRAAVIVAPLTLGLLTCWRWAPRITRR